MKLSINPKLAAAVATFRAIGDIRFYLHGIYVEPLQAGGVVLVATNGHALCAWRDATGEAERSAVLPAMVKERHAVYAERMAALKQGATLHTPTRICNSTSHQPLDPARHTASQVLRPGADDHRQYKSLGTGGRA